MPADLALLRVERIIFHHVPRRHALETGQIPVSFQESELTDRLRIFFEERIKASLLKSALSVFLNETLPSPVPHWIDEFFSMSEEAFVTTSQLLAQHLYVSQDGSNSEGILSVISGGVDDTPTLIVLKMEPQRGVTLEETGQGNLTSFSIHEIENLMLTNKTRVYKAGAFIQHGESVETIEGRVIDLQQGRGTRDVAEFFLADFLGCSHMKSPENVTKDLYLVAQDYLNNEVDDPVLKGRYLFATMAEMNSNDNEINIGDFIERNFQGEDRIGLHRKFQEAGITENVVPKDTSRITTHLRKAQWNFQSGLTLIGPPESFVAHVSIANELDRQITEIRDVRTAINAK